MIVISYLCISLSWSCYTFKNKFSVQIFFAMTCPKNQLNREKGSSLLHYSSFLQIETSCGLDYHRCSQNCDLPKNSTNHDSVDSAPAYRTASCQLSCANAATTQQRSPYLNFLPSSPRPDSDSTLDESTTRQSCRHSQRSPRSASYRCTPGPCCR